MVGIPASQDQVAGSVVYFSNYSNNTHRFIQKLDVPSLRIPIHGELGEYPTIPFVLFLPTYGNGRIPPQVVKFLRAVDQSLIKAVVGSGNTNFGETFCLAAHKVASKLGVPLLHLFELMGNEEDVEIVKTKLGTLFK